MKFIIFILFYFILFLVSVPVSAKTCTVGKKCGNSCINVNYTCHIGVTPTPTCITPQVLQNNVCVTPTPTCITPQVLQNNVCVTPTPTCITPQVLQNNVCVTPTPTCITPQVLQNNVCVTQTPKYPETPKNNKIVNGDFSGLISNYDNFNVFLMCVNTTLGQFTVDLLFDGEKFNISSIVKENNICDSFSSKYSHLTNILTVLNVTANSHSYRASLILNSDFSLSLFDIKDNNIGRQNNTVYNRNDWGDWIIDNLGCHNTREEVLIEFDLDKTTACNFSSGSWIDPYTGNYYTLTSELDIDHIVPLSYAHEHGAANWPSSLKKQFYNDLSNLLPVSASENRSKGDKSPIEWMPPNTAYSCTYVNSFMYIVDKYDLDITPEDRKNINSKCVQ